MIEILITWEAWAAALLLVRRRRHRLERERRRAAVQMETRAAIEELREPNAAPVAKPAEDARPAWPFAPQASDAGEEWLGARRGKRPRRRRPNG
ncbi:MAG: hypothetical protein IRZ00_14455 [Gemmatimonadetes bacterium]|nr:hypothetical protein [Gemmatimonadota bacterium]